MTDDQRFDFKPKTRGKTRAEYVKEIIEGTLPPSRYTRTQALTAWRAPQQPPAAIANPNPNGLLTVQKMASIFQVPQSLIAPPKPQPSINVMFTISTAAMTHVGRNFAASIQRLSAAAGGLSQRFAAARLLDMVEHHWVEENVVLYGEGFPDPIGWACEVVGFHRSEVRDARISIEWGRYRIKLEVDLYETDWEPDYYIGWAELRELPNPWAYAANASDWCRQMDFYAEAISAGVMSVNEARSLLQLPKLPEHRIDAATPTPPLP